MVLIRPCGVTFCSWQHSLIPHLHSEAFCILHYQISPFSNGYEIPQIHDFDPTRPPLAVLPHSPDLGDQVVFIQ